MKEQEKFQINTFYELANEYAKHMTDESEIEKIDMTDIFYKEIEEMIKEGELVDININGKVRVGKMLPIGTNVLLSNGRWKKIEQIKNNDFVISPNTNGKGNTIQKVLNIVSHKDLNMCEVRNKRTGELLYTCCEDHTIPVKTFWIESHRINKTNKRHTIYHYKDENYRAGDLADKDKKWYANHTPKTLTAPRIDLINNKDFEINPYLLGVYIGDGHIIKRRNVRIDTGSEFVAKKIKEITKGNIYKKDKSNCWIVRFNDERFENNKICTGSYNKRLPTEIFRSSYNYRKKVFEGLLDSDGYINETGYISYTTASKGLAEDIKLLAKTLGCRAFINTIMKNCQSFKRKRQYFDVNINIGELCKELHLLRKERQIRLNQIDLENTQNLYSQFENIIVKRISKKMDGICIEVSGSSKLFIIDNYIATHNSTMAMSIGVYIFNLLKKYKYRPKNEQFGLKNIARDHQEYSKRMRDPNTQFTVMVTDESNELEKTGENVTVEEALSKVFSDVQAGRYVHRICCSPKEIIDNNADVMLEIIGIDKKRKISHNRLYFRLFRGGQQYSQLLGYVNVYVGDIIKEWEKVSRIFLKPNKSKEEINLINKSAKKDWYVAYMIKKYEKMELITKEGIFKPRLLDYAEIILNIVQNLKELAGMGSLLNSNTVRNYVKMEMRKAKIPNSIVGEELATREVCGILDLFKAIMKVNGMILKEEAKGNNDEKLLKMKTELGKAIQSQMSELNRYIEINKKYNGEGILTL